MLICALCTAYYYVNYDISKTIEVYSKSHVNLIMTNGMSWLIRNISLFIYVVMGKSGTQGRVLYKIY